MIIMIYKHIQWLFLQLYGYLVFGRRVGVLGFFTVVNPRNVIVGEDLGINHGVFILGAHKVLIGNNVVLSARCMLIDSSLDVNSFIDTYKPVHTYAPIIIRDSAWIGCGAIVLQGVEIGEKCIVAAGSVVTKSVPPFSLVAGIPARVVRTLNAE